MRLQPFGDLWSTAIESFNPMFSCEPNWSGIGSDGLETD